MADDETTYETATLPTQTRFEIRQAVFYPAALAIVLFVVLGSVFTDAMSSTFTAVQETIAAQLGWFYYASVTVFLVFAIWVAFSRHGNKRLGPNASRPAYSYLAWFAMLFSAGMGIGLLFFSVAEPISHFAIDQPPYVTSEAGSAAAAQEAMVTTFFHWGLHAWAVYVVVGLALGYFAYRRGLPLALRSAFHPLLGDRIYRWPGDAIDVLAIVGTLFGVATSLGIGVIQISAGLGYLDLAPGGLGLQLALIAGITAIATGSVVLGLGKGIKRLSLLNVGLGAVLLMFVLFAGPTAAILDSLVANTGSYLQNLPSRSFGAGLTGADSGWQGDWTLFYWGWWVSWSPFVGMFIARISRGRTIREFVSGVLLVPTAVTLVVLSVFGQTAFTSALEGQGGIVAAAEQSLDVALFAMLEQLPLAMITSILAIVIIATFFITSSDSGSLVDDIHASGGSMHPHTATRVFWALTEGAVAAVLLSTGGETGLSALQQASIASGVPLAILLLGICWALARAFRRERPEDVVAAAPTDHGDAERPAPRRREPVGT